MNLVKTDIEDVVIIQPKVFGDHRGWFTETYSKFKFENFGMDIDFIQDNHSMSAKKGTLRGLHFQKNEKAQTKLVRCTKGKILDVAVDLRKGSPTYKKWISVILSDENKKQLLVPKGFAHGFLTLTDDVEVQYKVDEYYSPKHDRSIRFDDEEISVNWGVENPLLSEKDLKAPLLKDCDLDFNYKFMVTGVNGQLGRDVLLKLKEMNLDVIAPKREEFELTNSQQVKKYILDHNPNVIIHCAAYTAVDKAEEEKEICYKVNVEGTKAIVKAAKFIDSKVVYISSDYVFDGAGEQPHDEDKKTNPINYYGYTKEQGEKIIQEHLEKYFIVRTSWVYGANGKNFVKTMLSLSESKDKIKVVSDQIGAPTYTRDIAEFIFELMKTSKYGIYHVVNEGYCSWYEFAKLIFEKSKVKMNIEPIYTKDYNTKAKRPLNSRLSKINTDKAELKRLPCWKNALSRFIEELNIKEEK